MSLFLHGNIFSVSEKNGVVLNGNLNAGYDTTGKESRLR